jgi:hypothetical protein
MESLREVLMRRDRLSGEETDEMIEYAKSRVDNGDDPEEVLRDEFGLEPDYVFDIMP